MRIRTDDEVYRVDAVWLGPPKATMPWRVRYVAWGVGTVVFLLVMTVERRIGVPFGWSIPWGMVATVLITRLATSRITYERPLGSVMAMWLRELTAPREIATGEGGAVTASRVKINAQRPRRSDKAARKQARKAHGKPARKPQAPKARAQMEPGRAKGGRRGVRPPR
ncbi:hypothetical protein [Labedaea rhizosphaerae]|uniref:Uncharacterized protein n=1 Tax=Labedaea rhizosphaerae TaxID=598644 RepID=A0A4R6SJ72_LABRH|nr:hypothetical protein [Labedaea rhizosphaerae]TDQ04088.1 hypothetical protein EV186_10128 [Labedaea rhizosphaerae]